MANEKQGDEKASEQEVREVARNLWRGAEHDGARLLDGREHDGVFETEDCLHLVEATVSRGSAKARDDIAKMVRQAEKLLHTARDRTVQCWFVTRDEPEAQQREHQREAEKRSGIKVNALSFRQFQGRLINAERYLQARSNHLFGSARDPKTGDKHVGVGYVPLDLRASSGGPAWSVTQVASRLDDGTRLLLLGEYGAGKSMTHREVFHELRKRFLNGKSLRFPIHINLREHWGQTDAVELLERHARRIGYEYPTHLVRAWRAGLATLLIDGFDEVASQGLASAWRKLQDNRFRAMQAVREFVRDTPKRSGLLLAGRAQFFDSPVERRRSLGFDLGCEELTASDFTEEQVGEYLRTAGDGSSLPSWLPARPLLVAYLVAQRALAPHGTEGPSIMDPAEGWHALIERIAYREAEIEAGIDGATVRKLMERIASVARRTLDGLGPITETDLVAAFREVIGGSPEEQSLVLLQRLPGLGAVAGNTSDRQFVDSDFADACRAGDVVDFVQGVFPKECGSLRAAEFAVPVHASEACRLMPTL